MYKKTFKKIEYYLYNYYLLDYKIQLLNEDINNYDFKQDYYRYIINKSSCLENEVIKNIDNKIKIQKILKWKELITFVIKDFETKDKLSYRFICLKYLKRVSSRNIQKKLKLNLKQIDDLRDRILFSIYLMAVERNMLKII